MRISDENLHGRVVISGDGLAIGEISKLLVESEDMRVDAIEVKLRKEIADRMGVSHRRFQSATIEIPARLIQSVGDAVILTVPVDALREPAPVPPSESAPLH